MLCPSKHLFHFGLSAQPRNRTPPPHFRLVLKGNTVTLVDPFLIWSPPAFLFPVSIITPNPSVC